MITAFLLATAQTLLVVFIGNYSIMPLVSGLVSSCLLFWILALPSQFENMIIRVVTLLLLAVLFTFSGLHIWINHSYPSLSHWLLAANDTFITALISDWRLWALLATSLLLVFVGNYLDRLFDFPKLNQGALASVALLILGFIKPSPEWYAINLVQFNWQQPASAVFKGQKDGRQLLEVVTGEPLQSIKAPDHVILLLVEGLSQLHVDQGWLPELQALQQQGIHYQNFIAHQRQTNRGLFSLLCGAYPNLISSVAKSDLMAMSDYSPACLPATLANQQIESWFIQSANLQYMAKSDFAHKAGFAVIEGQNQIESYSYKSQWGVDDKALITHAVNKLQSSSNKKHFITLLTSGTHPPYASSPERSRKGAFAYADLAIKSLIDQLNEAKLSDSTLVLISSDEASAGDLHNTSHIPGDNRGFLLALAPQIKPQTIDTVFGQSDIARSILDIFEINPDGYQGLSIFEKATRTQPVFAGNTFKQQVYSIDKMKTITCNYQMVCNQPLSRKVINIFKSNDLTHSDPRAPIASLPSRIYSAKQQPLIVGRLVTEEAIDSKLLLEAAIQTSAQSSTSHEKELTVLAWDCAEKSRVQQKSVVPIPGNKKNYIVRINLRQKSKSQCLKIWMTNTIQSKSDQWELKSLTLHKKV